MCNRFINFINYKSDIIDNSYLPETLISFSPLEVATFVFSTGNKMIKFGNLVPAKDFRQIMRKAVGYFST